MQDKIITLRTGKKGRLKPGHPWIFKGQVLKVPPSIRPGDIVTVTNGKGEFVGRGYYNSASEIAIRLLTFDNEPIDGAFLKKRIEEAIAKRNFLSELTNAKRLIFSEADGLPGIIADQYDDTIVLQISTLGMERMKEGLIKALADTVNPKFIYEKSDSPFRKTEGLKSIKKWWLYEGRNEIEIYEGAAKFIVDIANGHKTGFYLDQRKARSALKDISMGRTVLDLFCYTGGFSVNAALGGAKRIVSVDIKPQWLDMVRKNAALNGVSDKIEQRKDDAFGALNNVCNSGEKFDIIVLDPPSFLKSKKDLKMAAKGYQEINALAFKALSDGGILCTFSCSHNMPNKIFSDVIKDAARESGKRFDILKRCRQDKDHPIAGRIPETEYLKGYFLKITDEK